MVKAFLNQSFNNHIWLALMCLYTTYVYLYSYISLPVFLYFRFGFLTAGLVLMVWWMVSKVDSSRVISRSDCYTIIIISYCKPVFFHVVDITTNQSYKSTCLHLSVNMHFTGKSTLVWGKENMILTWDRMGRETGVRCEVTWLGYGKCYNKEKSFTDERKDDFTEL